MIRLIVHEWLHGLFDWATESSDPNQPDLEKVDPDRDHWIMKRLFFD